MSWAFSRPAEVESAFDGLKDGRLSKKSRSPYMRRHCPQPPFVLWRREQRRFGYVGTSAAWTRWNRSCSGSCELRWRRTIVSFFTTTALILISFVVCFVVISVL
jgi:hypothetical protein